MQYNNLVHTTSLTGPELTATITSIKQELNCSTFCELLCFYWLTHVQPLEAIKTSLAWLTHPHTHIIIKCACSHDHTYFIHITKRSMRHPMRCELLKSSVSFTCFSGSLLWQFLRLNFTFACRTQNLNQICTRPCPCTWTYRHHTCSAIFSGLGQTYVYLCHSFMHDNLGIRPAYFSNWNTILGKKKKNPLLWRFDDRMLKLIIGVSYQFLSSRMNI